MIEQLIKPTVSIAEETVYALKLKVKQLERQVSEAESTQEWLKEGERQHLLQLVEDTKNEAIGSILVKFDGLIEFIEQMYAKKE